VELVIQAHLRLLLERTLAMAGAVALAFAMQLLHKLAEQVAQEFLVVEVAAQIQVALQQMQQAALAVKV
jgi:3-polyprenyl-4-hydroxybenzoate decarboxylase